MIDKEFLGEQIKGLTVELSFPDEATESLAADFKKLSLNDAAYARFCEIVKNYNDTTEIDYKSALEVMKELEGKCGVATNHEDVIMSPVSGCHNGPWLAGYGLLFLRREDEPLED